jgi:hypothetical protein
MLSVWDFVNLKEIEIKLLEKSPHFIGQRKHLDMVNVEYGSIKLIFFFLWISQNICTSKILHP